MGWLVSVKQPSWKTYAQEDTGIKTTKDFLMRLYLTMGWRWSSQTSAADLKSILQYWDDDLTIFLDSVEFLIDTHSSQQEAKVFIQMLSDITAIENGKVKIIMTSLMDPWKQNDDIMVYGMEDSIPTFHLKPLSLVDCTDLLKRMTPKHVKTLDAQICSAIAQRCNYNALAVRAVGSYLNSTNISPAEIHQFVNGTKIKEGCKTYLITILEHLDPSMLDLLIQLSTFENNQFGVNAAAYVTGRDHESLFGELDNLYVRSLLEVKAGRVSDSVKSTHNESFSLHILVTTSLEQISQTDRQRKLLSDSNQRLLKYGSRLFIEACSSSASLLVVSKQLGDEKQYFMKYLENIRKMKHSLPDFGLPIVFHNHVRANMLMNWFLEPEKRAEYFFHLAKAAWTKKPLTSCTISLWYAEQYFQGYLFDADIVLLVLEKVDERLKILESTSGKSTELCRALYFFVKGSYLNKIGELGIGIDNVNKAIDIHRKYPHCDILIARDLNLLGNLFLKNDNPRKAISCFEEAYALVRMPNDMNESSLHFDAPTYLLNTGSAYFENGKDDYCNLRNCDAREKLELESSMKANYDKAIMLFDEALQECEKLGMKLTSVYGRILRHKACVLAELEKYEEALEDIHKCLPLFNNLSGSEDRMQAYYLRGSIRKSLGDTAKQEKRQQDFERFYTDAEHDFAEAYTLLMQEGHFKPRDHFIRNLQSDYEMTLLKLGKYDEANTIVDNLRELIDIGAEKANKHMSKILAKEMKASKAKSSQKRKLPIDTATSRQKRLLKRQKQVSLELQDSELENPEPLVTASTVDNEIETAEENETPLRRISNWRRKSFSSDIDNDIDDDDARISNEQTYASSVSASSYNSSNDSGLRCIGDEPDFSEDSSSSGSHFGNVDVDLDERTGAEIRSWTEHKKAAQEWLSESKTDTELSCSSDDSFKTAHD
ncbi:uncharacterized protein LOC141898365 isoform X2 [Tubulanus polymorphus]|uniref:uncharacterized protein LOC141898365 isoform X2 n=1 Tax=Tubulanus polymorphus TaxID=672921 RepID=UPI003DA1D9CF